MTGLQHREVFPVQDVVCQVSVSSAQRRTQLPNSRPLGFCGSLLELYQRCDQLFTEFEIHRPLLPRGEELGCFHHKTQAAQAHEDFSRTGP